MARDRDEIPCFGLCYSPLLLRCIASPVLAAAASTLPVVGPSLQRPNKHGRHCHVHQTHRTKHHRSRHQTYDKHSSCLGWAFANLSQNLKARKEGKKKGGGGGGAGKISNREHLMCELGSLLTWPCQPRAPHKTTHDGTSRYTMDK